MFKLFTIVNKEIFYIKNVLLNNENKIADVSFEKGEKNIYYTNSKELISYIVNAYKKSYFLHKIDIKIINIYTGNEWVINENDELIYYKKIKKGDKK